MSCRVSAEGKPNGGVPTLLNILPRRRDLVYFTVCDLLTIIRDLAQLLISSIGRVIVEIWPRRPPRVAAE